MNILMSRDHNPRQREFIQTLDFLYVLSECCNSSIRDAVIRKYVDLGGKYRQEKWMQCSACSEYLQKNTRGYTSKIEIRLYVGLKDNWSWWGNFMFGLDDFQMEINS